MDFADNGQFDEQRAVMIGPASRLRLWRLSLSRKRLDQSRAAGKRTRNVDPCPNSLITAMSPPNAFANRAATANPRPTPGMPRRRASSERKNGRNNPVRSPGWMPVPRSSIAIVTTPGSRASRIVTGLPGSLYLSALSNRLLTNSPSKAVGTRTFAGVPAASLKPRSVARGLSAHDRKCSGNQVARSSRSAAGRPGLRLQSGQKK